MGFKFFSGKKLPFPANFSLAAACKEKAVLERGTQK